MSDSNKPVISLVLGIIGVVCCQICGPVAWFIAKGELNAINAGQSPESGRGLATAGLVLGIIGTILLALTFVWIFLAGGMAVLGGIMDG